jgi:predicted acetyltransferase
VNVQFSVARSEDGPRLSALLELYVYDFSDILGLDVGDDGRFRTPPLDSYWTDPRCHAFLVRVDDRLAGFAMVQQRSRLTGDEGVCDMTQFFVMRKYRRNGVGEKLAAFLFDRFRGPWEVREEPKNEGAIAFWRRAIGRFLDGPFDEVIMDDERWRGPVQRFDSSTAAPSRA